MPPEGTVPNRVTDGRECSNGGAVYLWLTFLI